MPIKQVTCCKCNTLVNKAVTYSIGKDQRACKTHEGVVEKRGELEVLRFQKTQEAIRQQQRNERSEMRRSQPQPPPSFGPKCWVCMNGGLRQDDFFARVLIEQEKFKLTNPNANVLEMLAVRPKERCIFVLAKTKCTDALKYVREEFLQLVDMAGGVLAICGPCCGTFKIQPLVSPTPEQLKVAMEVGLIVKPVIEGIAKAELAKAE